MKRILYFTALLFAFALVSCEKVIDLDLNSDDPKYVVEGTVTKDSTVHTVKITRTLNFDETTAFPTVDNAVVTITDNLGNTTTLALVAPGTYQTSNYLGVEGRTYTINVSVDGKSFTSSSTMPAQVPIDSLTLEEFSFDPEEPFYALVANRMDPAGVKNYYRFDLYRGKERFEGIYLQDDQFSDGVEVLQPIFAGSYSSGDTAYLEMMCIDAATYKYFYTLSVNAGGTGGAVPANPDSNFGKQCLGYFSAQTFERRMKIIP